MYISRLALDHYRSWNHCVLDLTPGINILQGANGLGKTNIVESIEVLSTGLSHRTSSSVPLVQRGEHAATIRANIESVTDPEPADDGVNTSADAVDISDMKPVRQTQTTTLEATIAARGANRARINGGQSRYLREILGTLPTVSFTPEDQQLVAGDPAVRRSFINHSRTSPSNGRHCSNSSVNGSVQDPRLTPRSAGWRSGPDSSSRRESRSAATGSASSRN